MNHARVQENFQLIDQFISEVAVREDVPDQGVDYRNQADREYDKRLAQVLRSMRSLWEEQTRPFVAPQKLNEAAQAFSSDFEELNNLVMLNIGSIRGTALSHLLSSYYRSEYLLNEQEKIGFLSQNMWQLSQEVQQDHQDRQEAERDSLRGSGTYGFVFMPVTAPLEFAGAFMSAAQAFWGGHREEKPASDSKSLSAEFAKGQNHAAPILTAVQGGVVHEWQRTPPRGHLSLVVG